MNLPLFPRRAIKLPCWIRPIHSADRHPNKMDYLPVIRPRGRQLLYRTLFALSRRISAISAL